MKHSNTWFASILMASALLLSVAQSVRATSPSPEPTKKSEHAATRRHQRTHPIAALSNQASPQPTPATANNYSYSYNYYRPSAESPPVWFQILTTVILLAFTGGLWWTSVKQWQALKEQAKITQQALITDKRPFVFAFALTAQWKRNEEGIYVWKLRPQWRNTGETGTKQFAAFAHCEIRDTPLPLGYVFNYEGAIPGIGFIGPKMEHLGGITPVGDLYVTPRDIIESQNGRRFIYLWGWAKYTDVFPNTPEHTTHFCWNITVLGDPTTFNPRVKEPAPEKGALRFDYAQHLEGNYAD
jgi:hypothetical protein